MVFCSTIYNEISPNGDDLNEYLHIDCLEQLKTKRIFVYNRWGDLVYENKNYENDEKAFRGESNVGLHITKNRKLPDGTYFYIFEREFIDGLTDKPRGIQTDRSWLYINR